MSPLRDVLKNRSYRSKSFFALASMVSSCAGFQHVANQKSLWQVPHQVVD
jgi:hypothetical protein